MPGTRDTKNTFISLSPRGRLAERSIGSVKQVMRCLLEDRKMLQGDWPHVLAEVTFTCNSLKSSSTGRSPHEIFYGEELRSSLDAKLEIVQGAEEVSSEEHYYELRAK